LALLFLFPPNYRYLQYILIYETDSELVISFFNRANFIFGICLFCIYVRNTIYVVNETRFHVVLMARYLHFIVLITLP